MRKLAYIAKQVIDAITFSAPRPVEAGPIAQSDLDASGAVEQESTASRNGECAEALRLLRSLVEQGDVDAQFSLGVMYECGLGVTKNDAEALKWFQLAAKQGVAIAQRNLGALYANGRGVMQNDVEALKWYSLAAEQGNAQAQRNLRILLEKRGS